MSKYKITRAINGISLNGDECVLDTDNKIKLFTSVDNCLSWLDKHDIHVENTTELYEKYNISIEEEEDD